MSMPSPASALPDHLAERVHAVATSSTHGDRVVWWARCALRDHDNPSLDVARIIASTLGLPLQVLCALPSSVSRPTARHMTFALEAVRDLAIELRRSGLHVVVVVDQDEVSASMAGAALVVADAMPLPAPRAELAALAETGVTVWEVDASCVVPMAQSSAAPDRAFRFRDRHRTARAHLSQGLPPVAVGDVGAWPAGGDVDAASLDDEQIAALVATAAVDHGVGPVPHTRGGSHPGYARWQAWRHAGLPRYADERTDPLEPGAGARMSAYLHLGCVSPWRLVADAREYGDEGTAKFIDELLIWRELAWHWCSHVDDPDTLAALPDWARDTLAEHAGERAAAELIDAETLWRGASGVALWDAAQRSLLRHGELHNNVRMTWGKALLDWSASPQQALDRLLRLNHELALDGHDPASYGGILWCLGLFDRPFQPPRPVFGTVRPREIDRHAMRIDVGTYSQACDAPPTSRPLRVAVVGGGVAGLLCARTLQDAGHSATVFDRGRRPGGRVATRDTDAGPFDHGAQYITLRDARLRRLADGWIERGVMRRWPGNVRGARSGAKEHERWVGVPSMAAFAAHLADGVDVRTSAEVGAMRRDGGGWHVLLGDGGEHGGFDAVVVALPPPQARRIVLDGAGWPAQLPDHGMLPCHAGMFAFAGPVATDVDGQFAEHDVVAWAARDAHHPGRPDGERWVVHTTPTWSASRLDMAADDVAGAVLEAFGEVVGAPLPDVIEARAHRWSFARAEAPPGVGCLFDADAMLALCGDWCADGRVEGAMLSGIAAAGRVLARAGAVLPSQAPWPCSAL